MSTNNIYNDYYNLVFELLKPLALKNTKEASILLTCTLYHESKFKYLKQIGGPALSQYQIELFTCQDIYERILSKNEIFIGETFKYYNDNFGLVWNLKYNFAFSTLVARAKYYSSPKALPSLNDDIEIMASDFYDYYKEIYNTYLGASEKEVGIVDFKKVISNIKL